MPSTPPPETTIWIWPTGLFPRRIIYYLRAQKITLSTLAAHNIRLVPMTLSPTTHKIAAKEGYPALPDGMTIPCMHIASSGTPDKERGEGQWVHESLSIIMHLEEVLKNDGAGTSILGSTPSQRAKTWDVVSTFSDVLGNYVTEIVHTEPSAKMWSGIQEGEVSAGAAAHAGRRKAFYMQRLEGWVKGDVAGRGTTSLSGEGRDATLADLVVMAQVCYALDGYGVDWLQGCEVLKEWWGRAVQAGWWVDGERLKACEGEEGWEAVLGK